MAGYSNGPSKVIGAVIGGVLVFVLIASIPPLMTSNSEQNDQIRETTQPTAQTNNTVKEAEPEPQEVTYKVGEPAAFGDYGIIVKEVTTEPKEDNVLLLDVLIEVTNNGKKPVKVDSSYFKLLDADDREFEPEDDVSFGGDPIFMYDSINPGLNLTKKVKFEIPADVTSAKLAMRDNMFDLGGADYIYFDLGTVK